MTRGLTTAVQSMVDSSELSPVFLIEFQFLSGTLRFWTGIGLLDWNGETWNGSGDVIKFTGINETQETQATGLQFQISGADISHLMSAALTEDVQGRSAILWMGFMDYSASAFEITDPADGTITDPADGAIIDPAGTVGELLADPIGPFEYRMDTFIIDDDPNNHTIALTCESFLASLTRPRIRRYTHEDQQIEFPGDLGLEFVTVIQNKEIKWGRG